MKLLNSRFDLLLFVLLLLFLPSLLMAQGLSVDRSFNQAQQEYDDGDFSKAQDTYESLVSHGVLSPNLFFNLGNTLVRQGKISHAILAYRRAWMLAPRDPDIQANLNYALNNAQALAPKTSKTERILHLFSNREWLRITVAAYWLTAFCLIIHLFFKSVRPVTGRTVLALTLITVIGICGIMSWQSMKRSPELVIMPPQQKALFAPLETATPSFALPAGSIVRLEEKSGEWNKIRHGRQTGWIKSTACQSVYPFHDAPDVF